MNIVLFTHPTFLGSQSMPRFARGLAKAFCERGHSVTVRAPHARVRALIRSGPMAKWAGYIDQYLIFPWEIRLAIRHDPKDTLYVFCDQALGPWVPLVAHRPHVVHCHDLLALRSALGDIIENHTSITGRMYQSYIRRGFNKSKHFISVSKKSRADLHRFGKVHPVTSAVVYNGMNFPYHPLPRTEAAELLRQAGLPADSRGILLHVGGNQWYKNAEGVIRMYAEYALREATPLPLVMVSPLPNERMSVELGRVPPQGNIIFASGIGNQLMQAAYSCAQVLIFPSLAEGFGWPIIEALACGCAVITTDEPPMTEVGGAVARYVPRMRSPEHIGEWAVHAAKELVSVLARDEETCRLDSAEGIVWAARFAAAQAIDGYIEVYEKVMQYRSGFENMNSLKSTRDIL